ncbi:MAG: HipA N-terminal domain-containing protein [Oscillospiraceae bacterium]|jgi:serine/threonine-protein kinase HipA
MSAFRTAYVYVRNIFAGLLAETDEGYSFSYDAEYLKRDNASAVSLTLPLSKETYNSKTLFPFFDGLIPEGWLLDVVSRNWKIDPIDRFGLLLVACKDSVGNVSIKEERA